jgi:hypothetical protein
VATDGVVADAVTVGGVRLAFVGADPAKSDGTAAALRAAIERGGEGIAGLVLELPDPPAAESALATLGARRAGSELALDPARCHGVPLRVARAG